MDASVSVGPLVSGHPTIDPVGHEVVAVPAEDASAGDPSLTKNLWLVLRSMEFVALLRVLSILHLSVCMPM